MIQVIPESPQWRQLSPSVRALIEGFQRSAPVDLQGIARALGLAVKAATLPPGKSGEIRPDGAGGFVIRVNRHDSIGRQRFTVAHEIAHYLLHGDLIGTGISDDALYRSNQSSAVEAEANRLASDIVMPSALVANAAQVAQRVGVQDLNAQLAESFQVSPAAMKIKIGG
ncbi:ImmA/IrrE family metallo-endopeptidase [Sphingobium herbicidovorans]|uniref:ImmA/IrrE family metallo-endopeptidase n=1 Tax=Sphingobium herbicidovorans TaxID=76947 RepID=UPI000568970A|nr:ImmA/IrrE family metallo-endopeptidase [Sphingobium herbicidovorans]